MGSRRRMVSRFGNLGDTFSLNRFLSGVWILGRLSFRNFVGDAYRKFLANGMSCLGT